MQAVIFCAGKSTRTYPLTLTKPKPLLKVGNKTILEHNLLQLKGLVTEVILVIGYKSDMIKNQFGNSFNNLKIKYVVQKEQEGTGDALICAKDILKDKFIAMNGDDIFSKKDIKKCLDYDYCVLGKKVEDLHRFGEIVVNKDFAIEIKEKPNKEKGIANIGLYVFNKDIFDFKLEKSDRGEYEIIEYIKLLNQSRKKVNYELIEDTWIPISYPWNLLEGNEFMLSRIQKDVKANVEKNVVIKGPVVIGKNTIVKSGSYIEGPVVIGEDCDIGPNCYIRPHTSIGNKCHIGNSVEIKNSIIGDNTCIAHLAYVGDSIIGDNVNFGAGTKIANLRHDNANVKSMVKGVLVDTGRRKFGTAISDHVHTGINTSIYPGRKIWPEKTTLPGEIVKHDIE